MAGTIKRTNPGDAANIFVRCMLSDLSDLLGGFSREDLERTVEYFDYKCPYTGEDISVEYETGKWVLDHLIPHNRESVGLNLYGNIIVTTKTTNAAKSAKNFEDFIRYETKGTAEEKELRIQKIRKFQKESGYFDKVKNIDEIKDLCKSEYDSIQDKLKAHFKDYESILGIKKENQEISRPKKIFVYEPNKVKTFANYSHKTSSGISKSDAIRLIRNEGMNISGHITFSSRNSSNGLFWANPRIDYLNDDWWLILNDIDNSVLYILFIPACSIDESMINVRADREELMDIQIKHYGNSFIDTRSKLSFDEWFIDSIEY